MNMSKNTFAIVMSTALIAVSAHAQTSPSGTSTTTSSSLVGNYQCTRTDANNTATTYPLTIVAGTNNYTFEWNNASGYPLLLGTGVMHPGKSNVVSVAFSDPKNADNFGIEFFMINSDGSLSSSWAIQSSNQTGTDKCTKQK